ncbi:MAG TPA: GatB/YqeY domain-containing protein [Acidimicrobiia bacterium]
MGIREELAEELKDAMRAGDKARKDVIRQVQTEVSTARSEPGFSGEVDDALYQKVIASYVKRMDKTRQEYLEMGERGSAMAEKLGFEIEYLGRWLPKKLGEDATRQLVRETIESLGVAGDPKSAGRVTGTLMKSRGSDLDGSLVARIVAEELSAG